MKFTEKQEQRITKAITAIMASLSIIAGLKALKAIFEANRIISIAIMTITARIIGNDPKFMHDYQLYKIMKEIRETEKEYNVKILHREQRGLIDGPENKNKIGFC